MKKSVKLLAPVIALLIAVCCFVAATPLFASAEPDEELGNTIGTSFVRYDADGVTRNGGWGDTGSVIFCNTSVQASVEYTFNTYRLQKVEIMLAKAADKGKVNITVNDGEPVSFNCGDTQAANFTVDIPEADAKDKTKTAKVKFEVDTSEADAGSKYIEFSGFTLHQYLNEDEINNKGIYVLDETPVDESLVKKEISAPANNLTTDMTVDNGAMKSSDKTGEITYTFKGTALEMRADMLTSGGRVELQIDGGEKAKINLYAATEETNKVVYRIASLKKYLGNEYVHTVTVKVIEEKHTHSTGNDVVIRGFNIYHEEGNNIEDIDHDQFDMQIDETWTIPDDSEYVPLTRDDFVIGKGCGDAPNESAIWSGTVGDYVNINFRGTGLEVYGTKHVDKGKVDVYIDGVLKGRVNLYGVSEVDVLLFRLTGLSRSNHVCKLVAVDARDADALATAAGFNFDYVLTKAINVKGDEDKSAKLDIPGAQVQVVGWGSTSGAQYYGGGAVFSNNTNPDTTYLVASFRGTSFKIFGDKGEDKGFITVLIDGEPYSSSARAEESSSSEMIFEFEGLEPDKNHEIKVYIDPELNLVGAKSFIVLDYIEIENYSDIVFEGFPEPDDAHKDIGKDPELPWRVTEDKEFVTKNESDGKSSGCGGVAGAELGFVGGALALLALTAVMFGKNKRDDKQ